VCLPLETLISIEVILGAAPTPNVTLGRAFSLPHSLTHSLSHAQL